jgi:hypothetical protein
MTIGDRIRDALTGDSTDPQGAESTDEADGTAVEGPAAASGVSSSGSPSADTDGDRSGAGSGAAGAETTAGGADAVPDTPDGVAQDYT